MKYIFDPDTYLISSEDGSVKVSVHSGDREGVWSFVLYTGEKAFGFRTDVIASSFYPSRDDRGLLVWRIVAVCVSISDVDYKKRTERPLTNATEFEDRDEQTKILQDFSEALATYDSDLKASAAGLAKARVEYGANVLRNIESGAYLA